uniref:Uncharacterized protein n=1 Tax=Oryza sativa subsp. japonica TaxID=39947 RepID=Q6Z4F8_ORYSJ|nr:hypothetical protein [Oryza sativa Japonica Group]
MSKMPLGPHVNSPISLLSLSLLLFSLYPKCRGDGRRARAERPQQRDGNGSGQRRLPPTAPLLPHSDGTSSLQLKRREKSCEISKMPLGHTRGLAGAAGGRGRRQNGRDQRHAEERQRGWTTTAAARGVRREGRRWPEPSPARSEERGAPSPARIRKSSAEHSLDDIDTFSWWQAKWLA